MDAKPQPFDLPDTRWPVPDTLMATLGPRALRPCSMTRLEWDPLGVAANAMRMKAPAASDRLAARLRQNRLV